MSEMAGHNWLPDWLRIVAVAAYLAVLAVHLWHLVGATPRGRAWHLGHALMALGMAVMFLPTNGMVVPADTGEIVFAAVAVIVFGYVVSELVRHGRAGWLWPIAGVDLAAMAYMFGMRSMHLEWLTVLLIAWFAVQALGWLTGYLASLVNYRGLGGPGPSLAVRPPVDAGYPGRQPVDLALRTATTPRAGTAITTVSPVNRASIRATLAVMSLGMAYMFLAMQLEMIHMGGVMPGM